MNDLEIFKIEGIHLDLDVSDWAKSKKGFRLIPPTEPRLSPSSIITELAILIAPLDLIPFKNEAEDWVLTAILKRNNVGVQIEHEKWQEGMPLWLPEKTTVYCPWPILASQVLDNRNDLIITPDPKIADAHFSPSYEATHRTGSRNIHPFELVPPAGFNSIGIVCNKNSIKIRRELMSFHDEATAICTNVERKLAHRLSSAFTEVGVQCFQDNHDRFQLSVCILDGKDTVRFKTIQNSWIGLHEAALKFFEVSD